MTSWCSISSINVYLRLTSLRGLVIHELQLQLDYRYLASDDPVRGRDLASSGNCGESANGIIRLFPPAKLTTVKGSQLLIEMARTAQVHLGGACAEFSSFSSTGRQFLLVERGESSPPRASAWWDVGPRWVGVLLGLILIN